MALQNPAFSHNPAFNGKARAAAETPTAEALQELYDRPAATPTETNRMSYDDVIVKTVACFAILLVTAAAGWFVPWLALPGALVGLALGFVNALKREPSVILILLYSAAQGAFVGGLSGILERVYPGVVIQAVLATLCVFAVTLVLFATGKVRASKRATKIFLIAMIGYLVFSAVNFFLMIFNVTDNPWGLRGSVEILGIPLGLVLGVFATLLAAYSLVLDFDFIQRGVRGGAPRKLGWSAAFGLTVTIVWLYVELLRLFAISRN